MSGRVNHYWGYNTLAFFAPNIRYAASGVASDSVREFKRMVKALHSAGLEVVLDVVYNHTAEGNHLGPTLSLRGIDNQTYYRLVPQDLRYYLDFTGCGNPLNMQSPQVLQLIMDSLRYWILKMHVDGFRFDLASTLARELYEVDRLGAFFDIIHQDPVISQVKLIAEPWDLGAGGYQVGNFPVLWTEWNGKYRDAMRAFWKGEDRLLSVGVPMLSGGDEMGRTQDGNNSAYCQNNELSWTDWTLTPSQQELLDFTRRLVAFRGQQPVLTQRKYFQGRSIRGAGVKDIYWLEPGGHEMTDEAWTAPFVRSLGVLMVGHALEDIDERGRPLVGDTVLMLLNAHHEEVPFRLPPADEGESWLRMFDTTDGNAPEHRYAGAAHYPVQGRSVVVFTLNGDRRTRRSSDAGDKQ